MKKTTIEHAPPGDGGGRRTDSPRALRTPPRASLDCMTPDRFPRRTRPRRLLLACLPALLWPVVSPSTAAGQDTPALRGVEAPSTAADQLVWTAGALHRVLADRDYPGLLALAALNRSAAAPDAALTGSAATLANLLALRPGGGGPLDRCRGASDPVEGTLCSVEALTPLVPPSVARELAEEGARLVGMYLRPGQSLLPGVAGVPASAQAGGEGIRLAPFQAFAEGVLEDAWRLRSGLLPRDGDAPATFASVVAGVVGFAPGEAPELILSRVPELRALVGAHPALASLGEAARDGESVLRDYRDFLGSVSGSARHFLGEAQGVEAQVRGASEWASQRSLVYLASRTAALTGLEDAVVGRIRAVGNAAVDLRREGSAFAANLAGMGQQAAVAALSGNVFSLAAGVASFFNLTPGALGPSAVGEVRALREVVESVRDEMGLRFQEVEGRLDGVFLTLDSRFGRLETLVAANHSEVREDLLSLHLGLTALGRRMDRMESNLATYMQAGFDRDHTRTLIRCLEHRERHLPPFDRMEFPVFSECLTDFRARGARDARDALLTDRTTGVDDASLADALADASPENLARRLPLLARAAEQRFGYPGLQGGRGGANPLEWSVAAQAYLTMLQDWPEHARSVAPGDLEALLSTGVELQAMLDAIVTDPASGERGVLLQRVMTHYGGRLDELTAEADELARRYQQAQLRRVDPASILDRMWPQGESGSGGGPAVGGGASGAPPRPALPVPDVVAHALPHELRTAGVLALEEPALVYRTLTADSVSRANFRRSGIFRGRRHDRITHTRTRLEVELRTGDGRVVATWAVTGPPVVRQVEEMSGDEASTQVRSSRTVVADPAGHFLAEHWPTVEGWGEWESIAPRPEILAGVERAIEDELRRHESASLNRVFGAVCQEGAQGPTVEGADRESVTRIRVALEGLTAARVALAAYLRMGLGEAASSDPRLRELLQGPDGLLDRGTLCRTVAAGESPLRVVWLEEEPRLRAGELSGALAAALERDAESAGAPSQVATTVAQLRVALRLQQLRARVATGVGGVPAGP